MDETDRPDDRRADGSWVLPNSESRRQRNHEAAKSENSKRKKTRTYPPLSCKIEYLLASNHSDRSIASEFFTGDQEAPASDQKPDANAQRGDLEPRMIEARQVVLEYITQQR